MNEVHAFACGIPYCSSVKGEETGLSKGSRATLIAVGIIAILAGVLAHYGISVFPQMGTTLAWTSIGVGALLTLIGISLKHVKLDDPNPGIRTSLPTSLSTEKTKSSSSRVSTDVTASNIISDIITTTPLGTLPKWIGDKLRGPVLNLKLSNVTEIIKSAQNRPQLFAAENFVGIVLRLHAKHIDKDETYDRTHERYQGYDFPFPSSKDFTLEAIVWTNESQNGDWMMMAQHAEIVHRGAPYNASLILRDGNDFWGAFTEQLVDEFLQTECQDNVKKLLTEKEKEENVEAGKNHFDLNWLMQRLFTGQSALIREKREASPDLATDSSLIGYWEISLQNA